MMEHPAQTLRPVQRSLLLPLFIALVLLISGFSLALQWLHRQHIEYTTLERGQLFQNVLQRLIAVRSESLLASVEDIASNNPRLVRQLIDGDREALQADYTVRFNTLREGLGVSHFYFHTAYGHTLLRLHRPERFGDRVDRHTMAAALGGAPVSVGIELGPFGVMALRVVRRVETQDGRLAGFVELGIDILTILAVLTKDYGADFVVTTHKVELDRSEWEAQAGIRGAMPPWETYDLVVVSYESRPGLAREMGDIIEAAHRPSGGEVEQKIDYLTIDQRPFAAFTYPLRDLTGQQRGDVIALRDISSMTAGTQGVTLAVAASAGLLATLLVSFLYFALRRVDRGIRSQQTELGRSRERLQLALSVANDGVWDWDLGSGQVTLDDRYYTMVGYKPGAFPPTYESWKERVHPDDLPAAESAIRNYLRGESPSFDEDFRFLDASDDYVWLRSRGKIVERDQDGRPSRFVGTHATINKRKQAEFEREEATATLSKRNRTLESLNRLSGDLTLANSIDEIGRLTVSVLRQQDGAPLVGIFLVDDTGKFLELSFYDAVRVDEALFSTAKRIPINGSLNGHALETGEIIHCPNLAEDPRLIPSVQAALAAAGARAETVLPLIFRGKALGTIAIVYPEPVDYGPEERWAHNAVAKTVTIAIENLRNIEELSHQARHDSLTGLPNRLALHERFQEIVRPDEFSTSIFLLLLDLNRFKEVNDSLGHHIGDELLCALAYRLRPKVSELGGTLYRLGGDEFAALIPHPSADAATLASNVIDELRKPMAIRGLNLEVDCCVGVSIYPEHGADSHDLLRCADVAMYQAKANIEPFRVYQADFDDSNPRRLEILSRFRTALENDSLELHYQPRVMLNDQSIPSCEALLRWEFEEQTWLGPEEFLPLVETTDLIHELTMWVLRRALEQGQHWADKGLNMMVSVNVSGRNLIDVEFPARVMSLLKELGASGKQLQIEITETVLLADPERALHVLRALSGLGISIAIDDFGTGYSSLSYLKRLPLDALKIDALFVKDMVRREQDAVIVQSTISLAHSLGLRVIAEGVESAQVARRLQQLECEEAQGYYFSEPLTASAFELWATRKRSA